MVFTCVCMCVCPTWFGELMLVGWTGHGYASSSVLTTMTENGVILDGSKFFILLMPEPVGRVNTNLLHGAS